MIIDHRLNQEKVKNKEVKNVIFLAVVSLFIACTPSAKKEYKNWEIYGGSKENIRYSSLTQIDTSNINRLKIAWEFHTNDNDSLSQIQVNPIVVDGILYGVSPKLLLFAIDAATGEKLWTFDPADPDASGKGKGYFSINVCRGVVVYREKDGSKKIFYSASSYLYCIDAKTGRPVQSFGEYGKIDLHEGLDRNVKDMYVASTTPGIIYKDLIIIGTRVAEEAAAAPGHIRAYNVHTGKRKWIFHTIPQPGEEGYNSWEDKDAYLHIGGANSWAGFSMDEEKGIIYAPIGSATYDFYGGKRIGDNLFANCILAINAETGKRIWHYQTVRHDVWDRDLPSAPALVTITKDGKKIEAVAQVTKTGFIFLLNRVTGEPVYPIEQRAVPVISELNGEKLATTQPYPTFFKPFVRQSLTEADLNTLVSDSSYQDIKRRLSTYRTGNMFNPPSAQGTVIFPGFDGGAEWGGPSYDPQTNLLYVNANEMPWVLTMVPAKNEKSLNLPQSNFEAGKTLYAVNCMACHGPDRQGGGNFPSLIGTKERYTEETFKELVSTGRRMMPAFRQFNEAEKNALASFVLEIKEKQQQHFLQGSKQEDAYYKMPYTSTGYKKFLTKEGYPAVMPPWGSLTAINLNTGELAWRETLGDYPEFKAKGIHTGTENYGGPVVTAGGLLFIAATRDSKFRAFNKRTGKLLWETDLPAPGFATPAVYEVNGKQFIVIACGGGKLKTRTGDSYVAFALPNDAQD